MSGSWAWDWWPDLDYENPVAHFAKRTDEDTAEFLIRLFSQGWEYDGAGFVRTIHLRRGAEVWLFTRTSLT